ncbi:alpha/beta fold hydrolase [Streptomyces sp. NPDC000410]|uniref:alpha/beta fold hydrolase n=1 Tax=Streptomyces sp. NPDC000410 TaxID=3154254 RepID=UPI003321D929
MSTDSLVLGAAGFIGRALVAELLGQGRHVAAAVRGSAAPLTSWLAGAGADTTNLRVVTADITEPGLGLPPGDLPDVRDVYNCAARFAFGLDPADARAVNVTGALNVLEWTAARNSPRRLVHLSGYRVGAKSDTPDYRRLGAYEASKQEGDTAVRRRAAELGVPLTVANPASVIGHGQFIGLASIVSDLWHGRLPAVPGGPGTFLPVVTLDHFARFLAALPEDPGAAGQDYWVLDDATPELPALLRLVAAHTGVRPPRGHIPVPLLRLLPRALTGADPETFSFLSTDRYPTASASAFAAAHQLRMPPVQQALRDWADHLVATRFGAASAPRQPHGFHEIAGSRTWLVGDRRSPEHVLLHGLPLDADSWTDVTRHLEARTLAADLPGLGRSGATAATTDDWLADLMEPVTGRPLLTAHSLACGPALRYALRHPDRIRGLVLIAPAFLQNSPAPRRPARVTAMALRRMSPARLADTLGVPLGPAVHSAATALHRPGAARRVMTALRAARADSASLREALGQVRVPVTVVAGESDPLAVRVSLPTVTVPAAGHYPQLTDPEAVARLLADQASADDPAAATLAIIEVQAAAFGGQSGCRQRPSEA